MNNTITVKEFSMAVGDPTDALLNGHIRNTKDQNIKNTFKDLVHQLYDIDLAFMGENIPRGSYIGENDSNELPIAAAKRYFNEASDGLETLKKLSDFLRKEEVQSYQFGKHNFLEYAQAADDLYEKLTQ